MSGITDEDLLHAVQAGDRESLGVLVARWEQPLFRFVYRMVPRPEDARDVCQETFLRILKKAERFERGSRFSTWMYQIALNLCRDRMRRRKRWSRILAPVAALPERAAPGSGTRAFDGPGDDLDRRQRRDAVVRALGRLPPEQREVLVLKEYEGLKFREIAEIVGCPQSTVKSRMYHGLRAVRVHLEREGITQP